MSQLSVDFDNNLQRSVTFIYLKGKNYSLLLRGLYFFRNLLFGSNLWYKSIGVTRIFYYCEIFYYSEVYYCEVPLYFVPPQIFWPSAGPEHYDESCLSAFLTSYSCLIHNKLCRICWHSPICLFYADVRVNSGWHIF